MGEIHKSDIIGARIVDIHQTYELDDGLECVQVYFTLDRGFSFITPVAGIRWTSVEVPGNAKRMPDESVTKVFNVKWGWFGRWRATRQPSIKDDMVGQIKQRSIAGVFCDKKLLPHYPDACKIVFDDGSQASNSVVAPYGTGGAGLYFYLADSGKCTPLEQLVDYFSIPLNKPDA